MSRDFARVLLLIFPLAAFGVSSRATLQAEDWPQWRGPNRDGVWNETGVFGKFPTPTLARQWTAPIGPGYSGPTVAEGRVFVSDRILEPESTERVLCFDAKSGERLWMQSYPCDYDGIGYTAGPRASVTVDDGLAYSLGAAGDLFCFAAKSGEIVWLHKLRSEYGIRMPIWGIAASPLIEEGLVIVQIGGADDACLVAFEKRTGVEKWRALKDEASYSAPIVIEQAGRRVLVCWTGERVVGLDPASGSLLWEHEFKPTRMVISIVTPVVEKDRLFVSSFYDGSLMLKLASDSVAVSLAWRQLGPNEQETKSLHAMISNPQVLGDYVYGVDSYGELRCLNAQTGERIWESQQAVPRERWATIHMVRNGDRVWMFNERGELIIARLSPAGYEEISRAKLIDPTREQLNRRSGVCWSHPAFANRSVFARNDNELVCASLAAD